MDNNNTNFPTIEQIYRAERERWLRDEAPRRTLLQIIGDSVPWWLIIVGLVFFLLSAPHTAAVFNQLVPVVGIVAPFGIEFGLLYAAFRRKRASQINDPIPGWLKAFDALLIVTSIIVNGAGSLSAVVESRNLAELSAGQVMAQFGAFPLLTQVALIMAILSAVIIPAGAIVAGEGLAALILEREQGGAQEKRWKKEAYTVVYQALYAQYVAHGFIPAEAQSRASVEIKGYLSPGSPRTAAEPIRIEIPARREQLPEHASVQAATTARERVARTTANRSVKPAVQAYVQAHPDSLSLSINKLMAELSANGIDASRTVVGDVLREHKANSKE